MTRIITFSEEHFAYMADVVVVDIDENEIRKLHIPHLTSVNADVTDYINSIEKRLEGVKLPNHYGWLLLPI